MGSDPTTGRRRQRRLLEIAFVIVAIFAAGLVTAGVVSGAGPLAVLSTDETTTDTTPTDTTTSTDTTSTETTDTTTTESKTTESESHGDDDHDDGDDRVRDHGDDDHDGHDPSVARGDRAVSREVRVWYVDRAAGRSARVGRRREPVLHPRASYPLRLAARGERTPGVARRARRSPLRRATRAGSRARGRRNAQRLRATATSGRSRRSAGTTYTAPSTPGGSATVAVLDTGVDGSHPDLDANVVPGDVDRSTARRRHERPERPRHRHGRHRRRRDGQRRRASRASAMPA